MNINLERSYSQLALRGKPTEALRLPEVTLARADLVSKSWPHNSLDFYISLDVALGEFKQELCESVRRVRACPGETASSGKLVVQLQEWLRIIKKIEFYHIESNNKNLFYAQDGLLDLYECGSLQAIYLLSEIEKYRAKNTEEETLTLSDLRKD